MNDFIFHNPDKVYFGKNQLEHLSEELLQFGKKVLLVYGGGSIKKNGLYDSIVTIAENSGIELFELSGVEPNSRHSTVNKGAEICKKEKISVVLAAGGGSEMDAWAVISNMDTNEKIGLGGSALIPRVAFENPEYSYTLPSYQTACGSFDIFNHVLDNYYLAGEASFDLLLEMQEAVMRTVVKWAPVAMKEPENYEARANLMWASSMALNSILDGGTVHGCACHLMEHELSAYYDVTHGHGLAIVTPRWLTYILDETTAPAIYRLGTQVFDIPKGLNELEGAKKAIAALSDFCFGTLGLSSTLTDLNIDETHFKAMAEHACAGGSITGPKVLTQSDVEAIYKMCL